MSEIGLEAVVIGPGKPGILKVVIGRGRGEFVADIPFEKLEPSLPMEPMYYIGLDVHKGSRDPCGVWSF